MTETRTDLTLTTPIAGVPGVPAKLAEGLAIMGVRAVGQLLIHFPHRYEFEEQEQTIDQLTEGSVVTARGQITAVRAVRGRASRIEAVLIDETGRLDLVFFNQMYMARRLIPGTTVRVQGTARSRGGGLQIANPRVEFLDEDDMPEMRAQRLRPVYPASESITSKQIEFVADKVVPRALGLIEEHLPEGYRATRELMPIRDAYRAIHAPTSEAEALDARRRLAFDELLLLQLAVFLRKEELRRTHKAVPIPRTPELDARIRDRFPFPLTDDQRSVLDEISADLARDAPMNRLLQGDVGSGKTVVALYAMLLCVAQGHQGALMAPTELLAEQHALSISRMLEGSRTRVELLTGSLSADERASAHARIAEGRADIIVGTHALLTERVRFASLALAVIDEQHRFGVHQRASIRAKGTGDVVPHLLVMTATPIPRTLAMTLLGDLDLSTIRSLPAGRTPIATRLASAPKRDEVYAFVRERLDEGDQAFVVVPTIDTGVSSGDSGLRDLRAVHKELEEGELEGKRLAVVHGRLKPSTRDQIMSRFRDGKIDALIATTVVEVGVDVPNATVMVIEHADRFGLAQLHQLRGRVGRGEKPSVCIAIADDATPEAQQRLGAFVDSTDGFELAEQDLLIRGPGEVLGLKQSGVPPFRIADLSRDTELMALARRDARAWIERSPGLDAPGETVLKRRLLKAHGRWLGLSDVP